MNLLETLSSAPPLAVASPAVVRALETAARMPLIGLPLARWPGPVFEDQEDHRAAAEPAPRAAAPGALAASVLSEDPAASVAAFRTPDVRRGTDASVVSPAHTAAAEALPPTPVGTTPRPLAERVPDRPAPPAPAAAPPAPAAARPAPAAPTIAEPAPVAPRRPGEALSGAVARVPAPADETTPLHEAPVSFVRVVPPATPRTPVARALEPAVPEPRDRAVDPSWPSATGVARAPALAAALEQRRAAVATAARGWDRSATAETITAALPPARSGAAWIESPAGSGEWRAAEPGSRDIPADRPPASAPATLPSVFPAARAPTAIATPLAPVPTLSAAAGDATAVPAALVSAAPAPAVSATPLSAPGAPAAAPQPEAAEPAADLELLAGALVDRLESRLRRELLIAAERTGRPW